MNPTFSFLLSPFSLSSGTDGAEVCLKASKKAKVEVKRRSRSAGAKAGNKNKAKVKRVSDEKNLNFVYLQIFTICRKYLEN